MFSFENIMHIKTFFLLAFWTTGLSWFRRPGGGPLSPPEIVITRQACFYKIRSSNVNIKN